MIKELQDIKDTYDDCQHKYHNWNDWEDEEWDTIRKAFINADLYIQSVRKENELRGLKIQKLRNELAELQAEHQDLAESRFCKHQELQDLKEENERLKASIEQLNKSILDTEEHDKFFGREDR